MNGELSTCARGRFHYARSGSTLKPFTVKFSFPTIILPAKGDYVARLYLLMICNKEGCESDFILFTVNDENKENSFIFQKEYTIEDFEMERKWIQFEVKFRRLISM